MSLFLEIARIVLPVVIAGGIGIFVILRMNYKHKKGTLGKKKTKSAQILLDSLIPFGMLLGLAVSIMLSLFTPFSVLSAIAWGPGIGLLFGYFVYEIFSKREESYSE